MYTYHLQVFQAVATYRSYSRAAREALHISQPAVSKHVQALEASLGVQLFHRMGREIALTEAGCIVLRYAQQVQARTDETHQALRELQGLERGSLPIGASATAGTYLLPSILAAFSQRYPGIRLSMDVTNTEQVVRLTTHGVAWQGHLHMPNNEAMKQAIMAGLGVGMVSRLAVLLELRYGLLYEISVANVQVDRQISVVYRTDIAPSAAARAFLDVLSHHDPGLSA